MLFFVAQRIKDGHYTTSWPMIHIFSITTIYCANLHFIWYGRFPFVYAALGGGDLVGILSLDMSRIFKYYFQFLYSWPCIVFIFCGS